MKALRFIYLYPFCLFVLLTNLSTYGQQEVKNILADSMYSNVLKEYREYTVYLPATYFLQENNSYNYPVVYVLDGNKRKDLVHTIYQFLADNKRPMILEAIIVAVHQKDRSYELTPNKATHFFNGMKIPENMNLGGADSFYTFLKTELHAHIQKEYRTNNFINLIGHSFGGLFALHALKKDDFFKGVVAIDPSLWWNNGYLAKEYASYFTDDTKHNSLLFLAEAGPKEDNLHSLSIEKMVGIMQSHTTKMAGFKSIFYEDKNHYTVLIPAIQDGLTFLLEDQTFRHIDKRMSKAYVQQLYDKKSSKIGVVLQPSVQRIITYGDLCMIKKMPEKAKEFYAWAIELGASKKELEKKIQRVSKKK